MTTREPAAWPHRLIVYSYDPYVPGEGEAAVTNAHPSPTATLDGMGFAHD